MEARYRELLEAYAPAIRRLCGAYLPDPADQQDLFQEIAMALWQALPRFRHEASERTWLYRIAHNVALTYSGKRRRQELFEQPLGEVAAVTPNQRRRELLGLVRRLPPVDRHLVLLYLEGLSAKEMEEVTGLTANNINVRLSRLRRRLAAQLKPKEVSR